MKLRFGRISEMDLSKGLARVRFKEDGIVSPWLSIAVPNTKDTKYSLPMAVNEHVYCIMDENGDTGVIGGAIYSRDSQPELVGGSVGVVFPDGSKVEFNDGTLIIEAVGEVNITASPKVTIEGNLEVSGFIKANGEVTAKATTLNVSLSTHIHPTPSGPSSAPTPGS